MALRHLENKEKHIPGRGNDRCRGKKLEIKHSGNKDKINTAAPSGKMMRKRMRFFLKKKMNAN